MEVSDREVIQVMIDGGQNLCNHAKAKWIAGKYGTEEPMQRDNILRWGAIERRIIELGKLLREAINESS